MHPLTCCGTPWQYRVCTTFLCSAFSFQRWPKWPATPQLLRNPVEKQKLAGLPHSCQNGNCMKFICTQTHLHTESHPAQHDARDIRHVEACVFNTFTLPLSSTFTLSLSLTHTHIYTHHTRLGGTVRTAGEVLLCPVSSLKKKKSSVCVWERVCVQAGIGH